MNHVSYDNDDNTAIPANIRNSNYYKAAVLLRKVVHLSSQQPQAQDLLG